MPTSSSQSKGSKKFQLLLTIMGLVSVANAVGSDSRIDAADTSQMFNEFAQSLSDTATTTKKTFDEVVESGMEYYESFSPQKTVGPAVEAIARHMVVPIAIANSKGRKAGVADFAASAVSSIATSAPVLEAKEVSAKQKSNNKNKKSDEDEFNELWDHAFDGNLALFRLGLKKAKEDNKLKYFLTTSDKTNNFSIFSVACNRQHREIVKEVIAAVGNDRELLREIFTNLYGEDKLSAFGRACNSENIEIINIIINAVGNDRELLRKMFVEPVGPLKVGTFNFICTFKKLRSVKVMLDIAKNDQELLTEMMVRNYGTFKGAFFDACQFGRVKVTKLMLDAVKDKPDFIKNLIESKPQYKWDPTVINNLLISGDWESLKIILMQDAQIKKEPLPISYASDIPHASIYYLEVFLKDNDISKHEYNRASYFREQDGKLSKALINEISLFANKPILIELENESSDKKRKVILGQEIKQLISLEGINKNSLELKEIMSFAEKHKVHEIVFSLVFEAHAASFLLVQKDGKWEAVSYNPNKYIGTEHDKKYRAHVKNVMDKVGIAKVGQADIVIPNYVSEGTNPAGNCDSIDNFISASLVMGQDHINDLKKARYKFEAEERLKDGKKENFGDFLGRELNPKVDEILNTRLASAKAKLTTPSPSVTGSKDAKKVNEAKAAAMEL